MILSICAIAPATAAFQLPHRFYGDVTINGIPAPVGTHITASVTGGGSDVYTTTISGKYGNAGDVLFGTFFVQPVGEDSTIVSGAPITFSINGNPAEVYEVGKGPWRVSYPYADDGNTNLNLRLGTTGPTTIPTTSPTTQPTTSPTTQPTTSPTTSPTTQPTTSPTTKPTTSPTTVPTSSPTSVPTTEIPFWPYIISATAGSHGTITPSGDINVYHGEDQTFTITPDTGYSIETILVDGSQVTTVSTYTFNNVVAGHTIEVTFKEGASEYFEVGLNNGWNLLSTPIKLASGHQHLGEIFPTDSLEHIEVILGWDGSKWFIPGEGYELKPIYAVYVKVQGSATAYLYPSQEVSSPPGRSLPVGWNLISLAKDYENGGFSPRSVEGSLISIDGDYSIVVSPGLNQPGWSYVAGDATIPDLLPYKGYWVYMNNPNSLQGFSTTPIS
jgi:hypothetical protein